MTIGLLATVNDIATMAHKLWQRRSGQFTAALAAVLVSGAGGAFALATLAPDAADLPVREVTEAVQPLPLESQIAALESHTFKLFRSDQTRSSDSAESLLKRLGIDDTQAAYFLRSDPSARAALLGRGGRNVTVQADDSNALLKLEARWTPDNEGSFKRLVVTRTERGFASRVELAPLRASARLASGSIRSSLFAATDDARIPDSVAVQVAEIFAGDIDFHRSLRKGDRFSVVYETLEADGEPVRAGRVLTAEFVNGTRTYQAMWFQDPLAGPGKGGYYTMDGQSLRRAYLASPLEFSRISSGFKMRLHPIQQTWRAHLGVDYAAPVGTPARSVADGVVEFAGVQNGFGNVVYVLHRNNNVTVYAHLSRVGVRKGQTISQGQTVGAVGSTGWATGPHLHFEFRVNGVHRDPLTIARQSEATPVSVAARPLFERQSAMARVELAAAGSMQQTAAQ